MATFAQVAGVWGDMRSGLLLKTNTRLTYTIQKNPLRSFIVFERSRNLWSLAFAICMCGMLKILSVWDDNFKSYQDPVDNNIYPSRLRRCGMPCLTNRQVRKTHENNHTLPIHDFCELGTTTFTSQPAHALISCRMYSKKRLLLTKVYCQVAI